MINMYIYVLKLQQIQSIAIKNIIMTRSIEEVYEYLFIISVLRNLKYSCLLDINISIEIVYLNWNIQIVYECHNLNLKAINIIFFYLIGFPVIGIYFLLTKLINCFCFNVPFEHERIILNESRGHHPHVHNQIIG